MSTTAIYVVSGILAENVGRRLMSNRHLRNFAWKKSMRKKTNLIPKIPRVSEKVVEDQIIQTLTRIGYTVWKTGRDRSSLSGRLMAAVRPFLRPGYEDAVFKAISGF